MISKFNKIKQLFDELETEITKRHINKRDYNPIIKPKYGN